MIICPNCQRQNMHGAIYCLECGGQLVSGDGEVAGGETSRSVTPAGAHSAPSSESAIPPVPAESKVVLYLHEMDEIVPLLDREEVTLGRAIEGQPIIPDLDLTPYNGYEKGVSRLHVSIKISENRMTVTDLGSANGTLVNGVKLPPNQPQIIVHGDILTLGKLQTQVLVRS